MAEINVDQNSWLNLSRLLEYNGIAFWDNITFPEVPISDGDEYIYLTQRQAQRLDLVAYDYYGDPQLMWAILLANEKDLPNQFLEGDLIRIPAKATLEKLLKPVE